MKPHKIRSVFSAELLYPPDWVKEMVELAYDEKDILDIISLYEFYVALIMRCTSFVHNDLRLREKSEKVWESYISEIQYKHDVNPIFIEMIKELTEFKKNHYYGASKNKEHTISSYNIINDLTNYCFNPIGKFNGKPIKVSSILKRSKAEIRDSLEFTRGINLYKFEQYEYLEVLNLLDFFERVKKKINFDFEIKKAKYAVSNNKDKEEKKPIIFIQENTVNQINNDLVVSSNYVDEKIKNAIESLLEEIIKNNKKFDDISKYVKQLVEEFKEKISRFPWVFMSINKEKLFMLVEYPDFIPVLDKLIYHDYVDYKDPRHFVWNYKDVKKSKQGKQEKLNILSCLILDFVFLPTKKKEYSKDYCTPKKFEPFSKGFGEANLYDNARKLEEKPPNGYIELLKELGLISNFKQ